LALEGDGITWTGQPSRQGIALFSVRIQFGEAQLLTRGHSDRLHAAERLDLSFLQRAQELRLRGERNVGNLIKE